MGYTKLFSDIIHSTVWQLPPATKVVWLAMLAMSDQNGEVRASIPGLARAAIVSDEECRAALALFLAPDPDSRTPDSEGRRIEVIDGGWRLINHGKYREMKSKHDARERAAERQRRFKARREVTQPVTVVTKSNAGNAIRSDSDQPQTKPDQISESLRKDSCASSFDKFWSAYPKRKNKGDAVKAWKVAKPDLEKVLAALSWQSASHDWTKEGGKYVPYPASYIRAAGWEDEPSAPDKWSSVPEKFQKSRSAALEWLDGKESK
jgi:hypothetical protein